jgi:hypothetical protein
LVLVQRATPEETSLLLRANATVRQFGREGSHLATKVACRGNSAF